MLSSATRGLAMPEYRRCVGRAYQRVLFEYLGLAIDVQTDVENQYRSSEYGRYRRRNRRTYDALNRLHGIHRTDHHRSRRTRARESVYRSLRQCAESDSDARIRLLLERLRRMVAHFDNLRGRDDVEAVVGASFGGNQFANALLVAEKHDAAVRTDCVESHHGSLDCGFGGEIAAIASKPILIMVSIRCSIKKHYRSSAFSLYSAAFFSIASLPR